MRYKFFLLTFLLFIVLTGYSQSSITIDSLTVEYLSDPIGIDKKEPLLSYRLNSIKNGARQTAYQIVVASKPEHLIAENYDIYDSGKVNSSQSINIKLPHRFDSAHTRYYWKVRAWDQSGQVSPYSKVGMWQSGLFEDTDWTAQWISNKFKEVSSKRTPLNVYENPEQYVKEDTAAVYLRKEELVQSAQIEHATAYISGLGYYELMINGSKVGDRIMDPIFTDYQKSINYTAYDVTNRLKNSNTVALGVVLGNGFYNHTERDLFQMEKANWKTPPKLKLEIIITYKDGSTQRLTSNNTWKWSYGPIIYNSIRGGETIDARINLDGWDQQDYKDDLWQSAMVVPAPIGAMTYQYVPPMREIRSLQPDSMWTVDDDVTLFDFGENMTGYADVVIKGPKGKKVDIFFNEAIDTQGRLKRRYSASHTFGRFQQGALILSDKDTDTFAPRFTYHGFRYVEVAGIPTDSIISIVARSVHTDIAPTGYFKSSNLRLNQLHSAVNRTLLNSIHGMPGEEPTREKMGWTYDGGMNTMESYLYSFDAILAYKKYLLDLIESQEENGHIPPIVPTNGWGFTEVGSQQQDSVILYDDPWWGATLPFVVDQLYKNTGDIAVIKESYNAVKKHTDFVLNTAEDDIVYWSLGDWLDLEHNKNGWGPGLTSVPLTSTAGLYYLLDITAGFADQLGYKTDHKRYKDLANQVKVSFNRQFLDPTTGAYEKPSQTGQAVPLYYGLTPPQAKQQAYQQLIDRIEANDHHTSVGFIGVRPLIRLLSEGDDLPLMYRLVTQERSPGWLHFVEDERSTMGENLNAEGYGTGHHPFATNIGFWLYEFLGGISIDLNRSTPVVFKPGITVDLDWVHATTQTLYGKVESYWQKKSNQTIAYKISIPVNTTGEIVLPSNFEISNLNDYNKHITSKSIDGRYTVASGTYDLILTPTK